MDEIRLGTCMNWKPAAGGVAATVTVMALDLEKDRALVHVRRAVSGRCASHWVELSTLTPAPAEAQACGCAAACGSGGDGHHAA